MLELIQIRKEYPAGDGVVEALKGVRLSFRKSEFVAILGPSGCGKTTMLNIIGGLDQYTDGDLLINGRSTKDFKDRDWDAYRNHSVGFVFQSYNLIPHQTVLQNVELALSLSGVGKAERRKRAKEALEKVGLGTQLYKKPGEMSGGAVQRVAIARAIVNDPDIILADEPTGALDTETSIQVMDILKEISRDRLVIMVTHNPELAQQYATRTIRMLDGVITGDSAPLSEEEIEAEHRADAEAAAAAMKAGKKEKKPSMSFATSFGLSLKNLFTKKGRTALTSFAGSIGIIGIALIYAVSQGMTMYIDAVQEDTLSSYPLTLEATHMEMGTLLETFIGTAQSAEEHELDAVYQKSVLYDMMNSLNAMEARENDLAAFKTYIEELLSSGGTPGLRDALSGVQYTYDTELLVYTKGADGTVIRSDTQGMLQDILLEYFGMDTSLMSSMSGPSAMMGGGAMSGAVLFQEMLSGENGDPVSPLLKKQYDLIYGTWPTQYNEIVLVVDERNELDDMTLYALGLKSKEDIDQLVSAALNKTEINIADKKWSYEEICEMDFRVVLSSDCYKLDEATGLYADLRDTEAGLRYLYDNGLTLRVSGIIRKNEDAVSSMLVGSIGYTSALTEYIIEQAADSDAVVAQLENETVDIFTGLPFRDSTESMTDAEKEAEFRAYTAQLTDQQKADAYVRIMSIPDSEQLNAAVAAMMGTLSREMIAEQMVSAYSAQMGMDENEIRAYIDSMSEEDLREIYMTMAVRQYEAQYEAQVRQQLAGMTTQQLAAALDAAMTTYTAQQYALYYDEILDFSDSSYEENLKKLGRVDLDTPSTINLYAASFEDKDVLEEVIRLYNEKVEELEQIVYTDYIGLMMSSVTAIINAITYVLIAFVAVSLVVSSIMIGVITLISVQERTKEIGILRAIGASKKNVSSMFNAETVIIGFTSGVLGVLVTYVFCIPINMILHYFTGIGNLNAYLPVSVGVILVAISVLLTLISGIIPSRSAAKKDPVVALRTE